MTDEHPAVTMARDEATSIASNWRVQAMLQHANLSVRMVFLSQALEVVSAALREEQIRREAAEHDAKCWRAHCDKVGYLSATTNNA